MSDQGDVAVLLDDYLERWLHKLTKSVARAEQLALVELIRSADVHSYFRHCFPPDQISRGFAYRCACVAQGIGPILQTFLPKLEQCGDRIPWTPSLPERAAWADQVLNQVGQLTMLRRLAHGERHGLVSCDIHSDKHVSIHIKASDEEAQDRIDHGWLVAKNFDQQAEYQEDLAAQMKGWARDRIDRYVWIDNGNFIGYDSDSELLALYHEHARISITKSAEADAFPDQVILGTRTFGEWKRIAESASARASLHISFASRLVALNKKKLDIRNLLTIYVRQDDLRDVWREQTGVTEDKELEDVSDVFMLTSTHAREYFLNLDYPLPYNVRFGKHFALLPHFGYLTNPCAFLVTELKRKYRKDWDKAVNQREDGFRQDLYKLLPEPMYSAGRENFKIRNSDGSIRTDIDAVLFEPSSNALYLFQLKWFDVFGHSLKERQSKLRNLLEANKWVEHVSQWAADLSDKALRADLGLSRLQPSGKISIRLVVLTRFSARFGGEHSYDERAAWISWPRLCRVVAENQGHSSPMEVAWHDAKAYVRPEHRNADTPASYRFPDLDIDLYS